MNCSAAFSLRNSHISSFLQYHVQFVVSTFNELVCMMKAMSVYSLALPRAADCNSHSVCVMLCKTRMDPMYVCHESYWACCS